MERDVFSYPVITKNIHFNSHAHVERDLSVSNWCVMPLPISTHTLTWSVTVFTRSEAETFRISTHTLTWSVTLDKIVLFLEALISTHTLTWSVTALKLKVPTKKAFQLTRSRGA